MWDLMRRSQTVFSTSNTSNTSNTSDQRRSAEVCTAVDHKLYSIPEGAMAGRGTEQMKQTLNELVRTPFKFENVKKISKSVNWFET